MDSKIPLLLGHISICVSNAEESAKFFKEYLGMKEISRTNDGKRIWLAMGKSILGLSEIKETSVNFGIQLAPGCAPIPPKQLDRIGFMVDDRESIDRMANEIAARAIKITGPLEQSNKTYSFYFDGPDGILIEILHFPFPDSSKNKKLEFKFCDGSSDPDGTGWLW